MDTCPVDVLETDNIKNDEDNDDGGDNIGWDYDVSGDDEEERMGVINQVGSY